MTRFGSTPFSKRADESERKPNSFDVRRTDAAAKYADSITTVVVLSDTSEFAPPITPATATGSLPFVMTRLWLLMYALDHQA